jgi:SAM-dependent methyltransferase
MESSQFYTGLVARLYAPLRGHVYDDPEPYARFIEDAGEPALELGCGDGDPLLALRERGLQVEGLDSSADMLERCRSAADERGLDVTLHHQAMEDMALPRRYRAIFLAGPTFNLLPDDDTARRALRRIRTHLAPEGTALIPLFIPEATPPDTFGVPRDHTAADGSLLRVTAVSETRDQLARTRTTLLRYEYHPTYGASETLERPWVLHWYTPAGFRDLAREAGLEVRAINDPEGGPATASAPAFDVLLQPSTSH